MIGGFYRPDAGSIRLGDAELAGAPAWRIARAGIARTYQTTQLFGEMSVLDNVLVALRRGRSGCPFAQAARPRRIARRLRRCSAFVGYHGALGSARQQPAACRPAPGRDRARACHATAGPPASMNRARG
jgi:branched-chain amino acid transport system permease protein